MLEQKEYVAIQDFSLNLNNGKDTVDIKVKVGDRLTFDGLNVSFREEKGSARSLSKVIGEWIALVNEKVNAPRPTLVAGTRNATGGRIVEHSDVPSDPTITTHQKQSSDDLETLIRKSEQIQETKLVNGKREVTSDMDDIKKEIKITNNDGNIVRKVTVSEEEAPVVNKESIEAKDPDADRKPTVLFMEGSVAKKTNYGVEDQEKDEHKKLEIDYEATGSIYKETSYENPAGQKAEKGTFKDQHPVSKVSAAKVVRTDVGSSTQAGVEATKTEGSVKKNSSKKTVKKDSSKKKSSTAKKTSSKKEIIEETQETSEIVDDSIADINMEDIIDEPTESEIHEPEVTVTEIHQNIDNIPDTVTQKEMPKEKKPTVIFEGQEAVVIGKVKDKNFKTVSRGNGITSKVTVGAESSSGIEMGDVEFSSNSDMELSEVTFSKGEDTASDIVVDDDIDVNDILMDI